MTVSERFLKYVSFGTNSDENSQSCPSTQSQLVFGKYLADELEKIGINIPVEEKHLDHTHPEYGVWNHDADLYNAMLSKVIPYTLTGVVWYQGESDASEAEGLVYDRELCALIEVWRDKFMDSKLPFTIVQIADTDERIAQGPGWNLIQEAQVKAVERTENAYLAISKDISERDDVHPKSKHGLAKRIEAVISEYYF